MENIFEIIKALLFGIVEGITEWLPVSSTGHMILLNEFVKLDVSEEFWNMFLVVIQFLSDIPNHHNGDQHGQHRKNEVCNGISLKIRISPFEDRPDSQ